MVNLAINGFGRIGRLFLRALIESKYSNNLKVKIINDLADLESNVHLFKYDSIHGTFNKKIKNVNEGRIINKVLLVKSLTCSTSWVSQYSHIKAKTVIIGIDIIRPANKDFSLAISDATTIIIAVIKTLKMV